MKKLLIFIILALAIGCGKEEIEPIKENCVYDCKEIYYSQTYGQFVLQCSFNDTELQIFDFQYHDLKCD